MSKTTGFRAFEAKVGSLLDQTVVHSITTLSGDIISDTPVRTGRAKGNWQGTVDQPSTKALLTTDKTGATTLSNVSQAAYRSVGKVFFLTNNVEYIIPLEYGRSMQSPAGMVRINIIRWKEIVANAAFTVRGR